jgi:hypothetical protein
MARKPRPDKPAAGPGTSILDRDKLITPEELADFCDVEVSTTDQWASRGGGPVFRKVGSQRRYQPADVKAWLDGNGYVTSSKPLTAA